MVKLLLLLSMLLAFAPTSASATLRTSWIANANYVYGPDDPSSVGHNSPIGTIYFRSSGGIYTKTDDGFSTNWSLMSTGGNAITAITGDVSATGPGSVAGTVNNVHAVNGLVSAPSITFANDLGSGLYRVGSHEIGMAVNGVEGFDLISSSSGGFTNFGAGGAASLSPNFLGLFQRDTTAVGGPLQIQLTNLSTGAGNGTKLQAMAESGNSVMEISSWPASTSSPPSYGNGTVSNGVVRASSSDGAFGLALIVDTSATSYLYHYVGGNGTANLVLTEKPTDFIYNNVHWTSNYTTAPTTTVQTGAGTTGTCTVAHATDNAGQVTITPGGTGIAAGAQCSIVFNASYAVAPICQITAAAAVDLTDVISPYVTSTTAHLVMNFNTAPTTAHVYVYNYQCIETQ